MTEPHPLIDEAMLPGARWDILRTLKVGGHLGVTKRWIRDQLAYLESRKLIGIERSEVEPWRAVLTRHGHDIADYQVECEPGIRRPPRTERRD